MFDGLKVCGRRRLRQFTVGASSPYTAAAWRRLPAMKLRQTSLMPCSPASSPKALPPSCVLSSDTCVCSPEPAWPANGLLMKVAV